MERLVNRRLEHFVEHNDLIPQQQFGFRKSRSALDCVTSLVSDIKEGFVLGRETAPIALDIKGAFNALLSGKILERLVSVGVSPRIINFVSHMINNRNLFFQDTDAPSKTCGVGVPQGVYCLRCCLTWL